MGTTEKLTRALQDALCVELRISIAPSHAAAIVGIAPRTFYYWLEKGAQGIPPYAAFARAVRQAVAHSVCTLTARALAGGPGAAQALGVLERRFFREYGRRIAMSKAREEQRRIEAEPREAKPLQMSPEAKRKFDEAVAIVTATIYKQAQPMTARRRERPAGRGQTLTAAVRAGILAALRIAVPAKYAAEREAIDESTFYDWIAKGEQGTRRYADFALAVRGATSEAVRNLTTRALAGGPGAAEALWLLERRFPQEYGQRFLIDQPSDADKRALERDLRLAEAIRANPAALAKVHESIAITAAEVAARVDANRKSEPNCDP
jgi:hypothetical protein